MKRVREVLTGAEYETDGDLRWGTGPRKVLTFHEALATTRPFQQSPDEATWVQRRGDTTDTYVPVEVLASTSVLDTWDEDAPVDLAFERKVRAVRVASARELGAAQAEAMKEVGMYGPTITRSDAERAILSDRASTTPVADAEIDAYIEGWKSP
ncbi:MULTISPECIES: hypothetical protein [Myxococcus]|uniref:hypothetical protein n=1 Tax=Myxococcus TaxID=32 RepID=UPI001142CE5B|nr:MULTISPECIES: hypothetical protein [Myxococcus]NOK05799.1 hypothetical protein [Myxococcus xanthus]